MTVVVKRAISISILFLAAFFCVVWIRTELIRSGYELSGLKEKLKLLDLELAGAEMRLIQAWSPQAAAKRAKERGYLMPGQYPLDRVRYIK